MGRPEKLSLEDQSLVLQLVAEGDKLRKQLKGLTYPAIGAKFDVSRDVVKRLVKQEQGE